MTKCLKAVTPIKSYNGFLVCFLHMRHWSPWKPSPKNVSGCSKKKDLMTIWQVYKIVVLLVIPPKEYIAIYTANCALRKGDYLDIVRTDGCWI